MKMPGVFGVRLVIGKGTHRAKKFFILQHPGDQRGLCRSFPKSQVGAPPRPPEQIVQRQFR